ncbi:hypothetical protein N7510_010626 [Penicillium lagena]|uniref:uncharacterized protein n=1 Tax=Penicillium lagena TaxID=94218 RepID=UPI0025407A47|nr:uncharacterized protein N7510_010626 [Penicillium lagena]KAJ5601092.1 hypothetical protein N7510_010626 [Penicillium lagena]
MIMGYNYSCLYRYTTTPVLVDDASAENITMTDGHSRSTQVLCLKGIRNFQLPRTGAGTLGQGSADRPALNDQLMS